MTATEAMFCYQCEQTAGGTGCTKAGVCGKDAETAALQDQLLSACKGIARYAHRARKLGAKDHDVDVFVIKALFTTVTNVNFDADRIRQCLDAAKDICAKAKSLYKQAAGSDAEQMDCCGATEGDGPEILRRREALGEDVVSLQELLVYGLKGLAAYADHAAVLGQEDDDVYAFVHEALDLLTRCDATVEQLTAAALKCGEVNLTVMGLLDAANTTAYGHPEPTPVRITPVAGKCILVSGHDLKDLGDLLAQTEGKGVNVYTHGEMLPCHGYPQLKKYSHLVGNYGGAWQDQAAEFAAFPGSILMTTNCVQKPKDSYKGRIFTTGLVAWPGVAHINEGPDGAKDFSPVIDAALAADGFASDEPEKTILTGFGHNAVMSVAGAVVDAVKAGKIRHFFLIGGCDGARSGRNYYTQLAEQVPDDCVILTLACGKYRFNKIDFGDIGGIPRLLDIGQCNDAYSAVQIAVALADAFDTDVNSLPLTLVLSWYEQKACVILLSLLHLGIKNIRIGPSLPAFVSPAVLQVLVDTFALTPISTPEQDLAAILN